MPASASNPATMRYLPTRLPDVWIVELETREDERGFFARAWCSEEFATRGLAESFVQANVAYTAHAGTVRGLHYQIQPHAEAKLVRCTAGAIWDVAVDLRPGSPTYREWTGVELSARNRRMLHVPEGFAHGYQALEDGAETFYLASRAYHGEAERGVRFDDPAIGIEWPLPVTLVSAKDSALPLLDPSG
jgi:dTDP-4-dehydrorhamnose 3,5-epimerase